MLKNFLETKQGKRLFTIVVLLIIGIIGAVIFILSSSDNDRRTEESTIESTVSSVEQQRTNRAAVYSGKWYSDREDEMVIELLEDGTFRASTWLTKGTYRFDQKEQIILEDEQIGEVAFDLKMKHGRTIMQTIDEEKEFFLYPDKKLMDKVLDENVQQEAVVEDLIYQKWLDVLTQGEWEKESSNTEYTLSFSKDSYKQEKKTESEETEVQEKDYVITSLETDEDSCLFVIDLLGETNETIKFRITESETIYELNATPGTFKWQSSYQKLISEVDLTQDGTQKSEAERITLED